MELIAAAFQESKRSSVQLRLSWEVVVNAKKVVGNNFLSFLSVTHHWVHIDSRGSSDFSRGELVKIPSQTILKCRSFILPLYGKQVSQQAWDQAGPNLYSRRDLCHLFSSQVWNLLGPKYTKSWCITWSAPAVFLICLSVILLCWSSECKVND